MNSFVEEEALGSENDEDAFSEESRASDAEFVDNESVDDGRAMYRRIDNGAAGGGGLVFDEEEENEEMDEGDEAELEHVDIANDIELKEFESELDTAVEQPRTKRRRENPNDTNWSNFDKMVDISAEILATRPRGRSRVPLELDEEEIDVYTVEELEQAIDMTSNSVCNLSFDALQNLSWESLSNVLNAYVSLLNVEHLQGVQSIFGEVRSLVELANVRKKFSYQISQLQLVLSSKSEYTDDSEREQAFFKLKKIVEPFQLMCGTHENCLRHSDARKYNLSFPNEHLAESLSFDIRTLHRTERKQQTEAIFFAKHLFAVHKLKKKYESNKNPIVLAPIYNNKNEFAYAYDDFFGVHRKKEKSTVENVLRYLMNKFPSDNNIFITNKFFDVVNHLNSINDSHFSTVETQNHLYSFNNGQYNSLCDCFLSFGDPRVKEYSHVYLNSRMPWTDIKDLRDPLNFKTGKWYKIRKHCKKFFDTLKFQFTRGYTDKNECLRWCLAMFGRILSPVNKIESGWEVMLILHGVGGAGKTKLAGSLCTLSPNYFNLSNNPENQFGFQDLPKKNWILMEEGTKKSTVNPSKIYRIATSRGEEDSMTLPVAQKHMGISKIKVTQPVMIVANSYPPEKWPNEKKQLQRRSFIVNFVNRPSQAQLNPELADEMEGQLGAQLVLITRAFQSAAVQIGSASLWSFLPLGIKRNIESVFANADPVQKFLNNSGMIQVTPISKSASNPFEYKEYVIPLSVLVSEFTIYMQNQGNKKFVFTRDVLDNLLEKTKAFPLVLNEGDLNDNSIPKEMNIPKYLHRQVPWPYLDKVTYKSKTVMYDAKANAQAFICGLSLNFFQCPRLIVARSIEATDRNSSYNIKDDEFEDLWRKQKEYPGLEERQAYRAFFDSTLRNSHAFNQYVEEKEEKKAKAVYAHPTILNACDLDEASVFTRWDTTRLDKIFNNYEYVENYWNFVGSEAQRRRIQDFWLLSLLHDLQERNALIKIGEHQVTTNKARILARTLATLKDLQNRG